MSFMFFFYFDVVFSFFPPRPIVRRPFDLLVWSSALGPCNRTCAHNLQRVLLLHPQPPQPHHVRHVQSADRRAGRWPGGRDGWLRLVDRFSRGCSLCVVLHHPHGECPCCPVVLSVLHAPLHTNVPIHRVRALPPPVLIRGLSGGQVRVSVYQVGTPGRTHWLDFTTGRYSGCASLRVLACAYCFFLVA
jgi:hypothetical protein